MDWKTAPDKEIVCHCQNIDKGQLVESIKKGNTTLKQLQTELQACTGGHCKETSPLGDCCASDIETLIKIYSEHSCEGSHSGCCCNS